MGEPLTNEATESDPVAELYDAWSDFQWRRLDAFPCELHIHLTCLYEHLPPSCRVLDIGAGPGRYAIELARAGHRVTAGDISASMCRLARQHVADAGLEVGSTAEGGGAVEAVLELDARDLGQLAPASFDAVVAFGPFYHLAESEGQRAAVELARVLRPGGLVFAAFKPRPFWLSMALHAFVTDPEAPAAQLEHLEEFLDTGRLDGLRSPQLRRSWFCRLEELEPLFASVGISHRALLASSGVAAVWSRLETWRSMAGREPELRHRLLELIRRTASDPHVLAMSDQVLFVGEHDG